VEKFQQVVLDLQLAHFLYALHITLAPLLQYLRSISSDRHSIFSRELLNMHQFASGANSLIAFS